jgi:hypothetical protein
MMRALAAVLLLAACAEGPPAADVPARASVASTCPHGAPGPPAPQAPRTVEAIAAYATALERARAQTEAARAVCARRLAEAVARLP